MLLKNWLQMPINHVKNALRSRQLQADLDALNRKYSRQGTKLNMTTDRLDAELIANAQLEGELNDVSDYCVSLRRTLLTLEAILSRDSISAKEKILFVQATLDKIQ